MEAWDQERTARSGNLGAGSRLVGQISDAGWLLEPHSLRREACDDSCGGPGYKPHSNWTDWQGKYVYLQRLSDPDTCGTTAVFWRMQRFQPLLRKAVKYPIPFGQDL